MNGSDPRIYEKAHRLLVQLYGPGAVFRDGQYEAIEAALTRHRTLVVQRTGWGKSLVYFMCTKLLRSQGRGLTLVVSPLLALMQNQMDAAKRMGLSCAQLHSRTKDDWPVILQAMAGGQLDVVFVTPESLFQPKIQEAMPQISVGMFVVDEAHCISDWGHDFRLLYSRLKEIIARLPANVPVLATTATANQRVIEDLQTQLGEDVYVSRGPLARDSLRLQILHLESRAERYAWLLENLPRLPDCGIVYCLTRRDCDMLAGFLQKHHISAAAYHSDMGENAEQETEELFRNNRIKVLVATVKLGMGYDKGDIAFVIHYQMPGNIVSYYQEIGRAGRDIDRAEVFLMTGAEDEAINEYFIRTAFPGQEEMDRVMAYVMEHTDASRPELESALNISRTRLDKALMFLCNDGHLYKNGSRYAATPKPYVYRGEHYRQLQAIRRQEMEQMKELAHTRECLSKFITRCLDDPAPYDCGQCANCTHRQILPAVPSAAALKAARDYFQSLLLPILPRKRWPSGVMEKTVIRQLNQEGICLSIYGDAGYGELVKRGKYSGENRFSEELVRKSAQVLKRVAEEHGVRYITWVPSLRTGLVEDFAKRLARQMGLSCGPLLCKRPSPQQKKMENSAYQCRNALDSFSAAEGARVPDRVILVDDIVDSGWTLTVCGYRLMERGCHEVYPFALASSSRND